jgi:hypothetical protein
LHSIPTSEPSSCWASAEASTSASPSSHSSSPSISATLHKLSITFFLLSLRSLKLRLRQRLNLIAILPALGHENGEIEGAELLLVAVEAVYLEGLIVELYLLVIAEFEKSGLEVFLLFAAMTFFSLSAAV